jgi:serine/threonine protein kinase
LHSKNIVHRDIKPLNILLDSDFNVKITDFGTAKLLDCQDERVNRALQKRYKREESRSSSPCKKNSFVGTNEYISPEVLKGQTPTWAIDLWSLGVILYRMYSGSTPFVGDNEMDTYENICKGEFVRHANIPNEAWSLIEAILEVNPSERIGCSKSWNNIDYKEIRNHPFFEGVIFDALKFNHGQIFKNLSDEQDNNGNRQDIRRRPTVTSFAVPCPMDDDDEDFEVDCFTPESKQKNRHTLYESFKFPDCQYGSQKDLISFLQNDHFLETTPKNSQKCDTQKYIIPILFDEDSDVVFNSTVGTSSPCRKAT